MMDVESKATIKSRMLRFYNTTVMRAGIASPNSGAGSQVDFIFDAFAQTFSLAQSRQKKSIETLSPSQLTGDDLDRYLNDFKFPRKEASQSVGVGQYAGSYSAYLTNSYRLYDAGGRAITVVSPGWYAPGSKLPLIATDGGSYTLAAGSKLTWQTTPPGGDATVSVTSAIDGGVSRETDAQYWSRWQQYVQNALSGSEASLWNFFLSVDPSVVGGFVYPCVNGAGTTHVALMANPTQSATRSRVVNQTTVAVIQQLVNASYPGGSNLLVQSVADNPLDVMVRIDCGTWLGQYPLPANKASNPTPVTLSGASGTAITFVCDYNLLQYAAYSGTQPSLPFSGTKTLTQPIPIQWIAPNGAVVSSSILAITAVTVTGSQFIHSVILSNALSVTDGSTHVTYAASIGSWIMPALSNATDVLSAVYAQFARLGPGEKLNTTKQRLKRYPPASARYPSALTADLTAAIVSVDGIANADIPYLYDNTAGGARSLGTPPTYSTYLGAVTDPALCFAPGNIAFYPINGVNK